MTYEERILAVRTEFYGFTIRKKGHSALMRVLAYVLFFNKQFMSSYVTTLGHTMWVPDTWDQWPAITRERLVRHEVVHMRQQRRLTFPLYAFLYMFFPTPFVLSWSRARFEWEAYSETIRAYAEARGIAYVKELSFRAFILQQFTSSAYGCMWPFSGQVNRWYDKLLLRMQQGT